MYLFLMKNVSFKKLLHTVLILTNSYQLILFSDSFPDT